MATNTKELIKRMRQLEADFCEWQKEHGMVDADGEWGGIGLALDALEEYDARNWLDKWEHDGIRVGGWLLETTDRDGKWVPLELHIDGVPEGGWNNVPDDFYAGETWRHILTGGPSADWCSLHAGDDWGVRLGVDFDPNTADKSRHIYGGEVYSVAQGIDYKILAGKPIAFRHGMKARRGKE